MGAGTGAETGAGAGAGAVGTLAAKGGIATTTFGSRKASLERAVDNFEKGTGEQRFHRY